MLRILAICDAKQETIRNLFKYNHLKDQTLLCLTLNDSARERGRAAKGRGRHNGYGTEDQDRLAREFVQECAQQKGYEVRQVLDAETTRYVDTADEMITVGFKLTKKK